MSDKRRHGPFLLSYHLSLFWHMMMARRRLPDAPQSLREPPAVFNNPAGHAAAPGRRRKMKVRVTREKVSVRSRKTYVSGRAAGQ